MGSRLSLVVFSLFAIAFVVGCGKPATSVVVPETSLEESDRQLAEQERLEMEANQ